MENKEIKINVPKGMEIDKENSTFECIKFKPIKNELPKTWKEFCENNNVKEGEFYIDNLSYIKETYATGQDPAIRDEKSDRNLLPSKKLAEAMLALCQLIQLRDCYNDGWTPNWNCGDTKYCIMFIDNQSAIVNNTSIQKILAFKTSELRDEFLENFKDLIEIAKPLL